jgi:hypothetical protein
MPKGLILSDSRAQTHFCVVKDLFLGNPSEMEKIWRASCLAHFTWADFDFLCRSLGSRRENLEVLWADPVARRELLDLEDVLVALLDDPLAVSVSAPFYFYVLTRNAFLRAGIEDPGLADYVAGVLAERVGAEPHDPLKGIPAGLLRVADFMAMMSGARGRVRVQLQLAAGDQFLVLTGLFPGLIEERRKRRGAPGLDFYENFARSAYRDVAESRDVTPGPTRRLLAGLSECLPEARRSLNRIAEESLFLGD